MDGSIVLVAKCPRPGHSKTRLIPLLGAEGAADFARAMLSDILANLTRLVRVSGENDNCNCIGYW